MRAAHTCLEGTYDSPGAAADAYGCQRQLVNYYVRKMANAGVTRSTSASSEARELEFNVEEETSAPPQDELAAVHERKKARAECRMQKSAELLQRGSTLANLLRHEGQLARLTVHDVMSALAFRGVQIPKGAKKPELIELLRANLQLPSGSSNTVNTIDAVACDDVGAYACDAGPSGFASDARADMLTCADSDNDESSGSES